MPRRLLCSLLFVLCAAVLVSAADRYPLRVSPDHRHLVDQNGAPYLVQGDAAWSLISGLTKEEAEMYLEAAAARDSTPSSST